MKKKEMEEMKEEMKKEKKNDSNFVNGKVA